MKRLQNICEELMDVWSDIVCDINEYDIMARNGEISPEECNEKQDALSKQADAIEEACKKLEALL